MTNFIKVFENKQFGSVRTFLIGDEPYLVGKEVAEILGYAKPLNAIAAGKRPADKTAGESERGS